jgi:hypothetical protein
MALPGKHPLSAEAACSLQGCGFPGFWARTEPVQ